LLKKIYLTSFAAAAACGALSVTDWLNVNGANQLTYLRQYEDGKRWTWDILQTEVWAWRVAAGVEAEFNHPRKPVFETLTYEDIKGDRLAHRYLRYRDAIFDARAGTYDKTLGKGLTLRSYEDRDFGVYQRLDGAALDVSAPFAGRDWGGVSLVWGRNKRDEEEQDHYDRVAGGQLTVRPVDFFYATGSYVQAKVENLNTFQEPRPVYDEELVAGGVGGWWKYFDIYGEYAERSGYSLALLEDHVGHGFYGIATVYPPRASVTVEYKRYDDLAYPYNNPPAVSYDTRMITGGLGASPFEDGYFAQLTTNPWEPLRLRGGYSYADDKRDRAAVKNEEIKEGFGMVRYDFSVPVAAEVGYEHIEQVYYPAGGKTGEMRRRPLVRLSWTPWADHSFSCEIRRERRTDFTLVDGDFIDNRASVGYNFSSWLGITVDYEDSTQKVQEFVSPGDPNDPEDDIYRYKNNWLWGEIRLTWYNKLLQNHVFSVGYGSQRGGFVCSSGVCRQQAPFAGLKVGLESSF